MRLPFSVCLPYHLLNALLSEADEEALGGLRDLVLEVVEEQHAPGHDAHELVVVAAVAPRRSGPDVERLVV